jgi:NAD(P)-dependent dehydrogenase (short-subunit alcohol dehydrogenase family)
MRFANRTAIVTGAASGIGLACAGILLEEGANVVFADIDEAGLAGVMEAMPQAFAKRASPVVCDVGNARQVEALVAHALNTYGNFDTIICAAGVVHRAPFSDLDEHDFDRVLRANLKGVFLCVQTAAKAMLEQRDRGRDILGSIVTFSNDAAFEAIPHVVPHVLAAGGVEKLTIAMARGFANAGIRINTVAVGMTDTPMLRAATGTGKTAFNTGMARMVQGRLSDADEIAKVAAFLASQEAAVITGQIMGTGAQ